MDDELSRPGRRTVPKRGGDDAPPTVLRLHHSADLIEAVPFLIGFQPRDSVVLVGIEGGPGDIADSGGRVRITVRMDIADLSAPPSKFPAFPGAGAVHGPSAGDPAVDDGAYRAAVAIHRSGATAVVGVVFVDSEPGAVGANEAANQAGRACKQVGLELGDLVVVATPGLTGAAPEGADQVTSRVAAEATYAGLVALHDRGDLVELLAPEPAIDRVRLCPALKAEERIV